MPRPSPSGTLDRLRREAARLVAEEEIRRWRRLYRRVRPGVCRGRRLQRPRRRTGSFPRDRGHRGHPERVPGTGPAGRAASRSAHRRPCCSRDSSPIRPTSTQPSGWLSRSGRRCGAWCPTSESAWWASTGPTSTTSTTLPRTSVVGRVPDIADELARADLVVVPVRYGSGTRLKIIEAFAQRVPVVSTTLGAEGLDVADGVHLLLGDTASALAEACARLLAIPNCGSPSSRGARPVPRALPERRSSRRKWPGWPAGSTGDAGR